MSVSMKINKMCVGEFDCETKSCIFQTEILLLGVCLLCEVTFLTWRSLLCVVAKDLWRSSGPTSCSRQGRLQS